MFRLFVGSFWIYSSCFYLFFLYEMGELVKSMSIFLSSAIDWLIFVAAQTSCPFSCFLLTWMMKQVPPQQLLCCSILTLIVDDFLVYGYLLNSIVYDVLLISYVPIKVWKTTDFIFHSLLLTHLHLFLVGTFCKLNILVTLICISLIQRVGINEKLEDWKLDEKAFRIYMSLCD